MYISPYPNTIRTLRHEWTHDAFEAGAIQAKAAAQMWMDRYAESLGVDRFTLLMHAEDYVDHDDYWIEGGRFEGASTPDAFWSHYEALTGKPVHESKRGSFLSCSC